MAAESLRRVVESVADYQLVWVAYDGREALRKCHDLCPDIVLMDLIMPEMDGIELAQHCSEISPETKVIFITGFAAVTLKANREAPQAKVLSKPFHLKDLVMEVQRVFGEPTQLSV